jgi:ribonuclease P protein component
MFMENFSENIDKSKTGFSFKKEERLCSKKIIDKLFSEGESFLAFPFKIVFLPLTSSSKFPVQVGFSVGKRNFKRAVKRNLIKRKMREAYRLQKAELYGLLNEKKLAVFFIFIGKTIPTYKEVENGIKKGIKKLAKEISSE